MDVPRYLRILWSSKWLLLIGAVIAATAAFFAGFTFQEGDVVSRATKSYHAASTVLVSNPGQPIYQAELPGETIQEGTTAPITRDLTQTAVLFAYIVSGSEIRTQVESQVGTFADDESIRAVRRTTQPGGDEANPGRFTLPILDIIGTASTPERAEKISRAANAAFQAYVEKQQVAIGITDDTRVVLETIDEGAAVENDGSSSMIPVVVTGVGVFLLFVVLAFIFNSYREWRVRRAAAAAAAEKAALKAGKKKSKSIDDIDEDHELRSLEAALADADQPAIASRN